MKINRLSRGSFIAAATAATIVPRNARAQTNPQRLVPADESFARVKLDSGRVIRTVVGLRPFRRSGFVLRAENRGEKLLVHNYGHGGGGFSLSWGCAQLAADFVTDRSPSRAAVLGCGIVGLTTARTLQDRGWSVTIYASKLPPQTTSNVAGAQWTPTTVFSRGAVTPAFLATFRRASALADRAFQLLEGPAYGVRWLNYYTLKRSADDRDELDYANEAGIEDLYADVENIEPSSTPFSLPVVRRFASMLVEPNTFLPAIERDYLLRGGKISVQTFAEQQQVLSLSEPVIFNCTGLGLALSFTITNSSRCVVSSQSWNPNRKSVTAISHTGSTCFPAAMGS